MATKDDDKVGAPKVDKAPGDVELGGAGGKAPAPGPGGPTPGLTGAGTVRGGSTVPPEDAPPPEPGTVVVPPAGSSPPTVDARGQPNEALQEPKPEDAEAEAKKQRRDGDYQSSTG